MNGIYHNDIKQENIVILDVDDTKFLSIIDYGGAVTHKEMMDRFDTNLSLPETDKKILHGNTDSSYSPEYNVIYKSAFHKTNSDLYEYALKAMTHWIIGGICIDILNFGADIQNMLFLKIYGDFIYYQTGSNDYGGFERKKHVLKAVGKRKNNIVYTTELLKFLKPEELQYEYTYKYDDLYGPDQEDYSQHYPSLHKIITNLLSVDIKELLSVHYDKFKDIPEYQEYLRKREASRIDD